jgi:hypothetical protein
MQQKNVSMAGLRQQLSTISLPELRKQLPANKEGNRVVVVSKQDEKLPDFELFLKYANR